MRYHTVQPLPLTMPHMTQNDLKQQAAEAALDYVEHGVIGVGTGSTVNYFISALAGIKHRIDGVVSSSERSTRLLQHHGIHVLDLNETGDLPLYVDGADECNRQLALIKGGGGALTREKVIAAASRQFVCIADSTKLVPVLGSFPLPVEVIPMARSFVARQLARMGGRPQWRTHEVTDNGNAIVDVYDLDIMTPIEWEQRINAIAGVVTVGLFAMRPADVLLLGDDNGVKTLTAA